jgi:enoyl-CoA hydratase/carnithine racemase
VWKVCEPDELLADARRHAEVLAAKPIPSLIAVKEAMVEPTRAEIAAARAREDAYFADLMGAQANAEALAEFTRGRSGTATG